MKRLKSSIKNIRRPSGQADLQEWEEMVSALEGAKFKLEKENELLQEQYTRKTKENNLLQQNLNNAASRSSIRTFYENMVVHNLVKTLPLFLY